MILQNKRKIWYAKVNWNTISYLAARLSLEPRPLQVFIHFFFLFCPSDPPSQETGRWETKHFIGMAYLKSENVSRHEILQQICPFLSWNHEKTKFLGEVDRSFRNGFSGLKLHRTHEKRGPDPLTKKCAWSNMKVIQWAILIFIFICSEVVFKQLKFQWLGKCNYNGIV